MRRLLISTLSATFMALLILDAKTGAQGALEGVELCLKVVIPSLLPFLFLSGIFGNYAGSFSLTILRPVCRVIGIPQDKPSIFMLGILGGYPIGAKNVYDTYSRGEISKESAERLLGFCNNAGPSFLFGMLSGIFPCTRHLFYIWTIQILSAFLTGVILPNKTMKSEYGKPAQPLEITQLFFSSLKAMVSICGWVIIFRTLYQIISKYLLRHCTNVLGALIMGLLELTNGCLMLSNISSVPVRFILCNVLLSFGGLCIWMQTSSVTRGLEKKIFYRGKCIQSIISLILALLFTAIL